MNPPVATWPQSLGVVRNRRLPSFMYSIEVRPITSIAAVPVAPLRSRISPSPDSPTFMLETIFLTEGCEKYWALENEVLLDWKGMPLEHNSRDQFAGFANSQALSLFVAAHQHHSGTSAISTCTGSSRASQDGDTESVASWCNVPSVASSVSSGWVVPPPSSNASSVSSGWVVDPRNGLYSARVSWAMVDIRSWNLEPPGFWKS